MYKQYVQQRKEEGEGLQEQQPLAGLPQEAESSHQTPTERMSARESG